MQRSFFQSFTATGVSLALAGTLLAYADSALNSSSVTLSADGLLTPRTRAVISGEYAYLLGMPETVIPDARIATIAASPTGDAVLIAAYKRRPFRGITLPPATVEPIQSELNLVYWDTRTRTSKTLLREAVRENSSVAIEQIAWLPQTRLALIVLSRRTTSPDQPPLSDRTLLRADTTAGTVSRVTDFSVAKGGNWDWRMEGSAAGLVVSPSQPLAYVSVNEDTETKSGPPFRTSLRAYTPRGFRPPVSLPDGAFGLTWMSDGKTVYSDTMVVIVQGKLKLRKQLTLVNLETGEVTQPEKLPAIPASEKAKKAPSMRESWAIDVAAANASLQNSAGKPQPASALWLRAAGTAKKEAAPAPAQGSVAADSLLIATHARLETQLATENTAAVLFTRDGSLCATPIFRLPARALEDALRGIQRTATMSNAKQIGIALMMYSQDYDENLPLPGSGVQDAAGPYLKNPSVFANPGTGENGFVYSYQGPTGVGQIGQPATTQLGFVSGPGGRAIIWADGHVTWEDTP